MDEFVPTCCFCFKMRDDRNTEADKGPWVDLSTYARRRQLPLSHRFVFSHGYCPDCVAQFDERMAAYRSTSARKSLSEAAHQFMAGVARALRTHSRTVRVVEDVSSDRGATSEAVS